ncbi:hypothetical protein [Flagellimonas meridianipacifica]|uniref:AP2/ERF domain-containing protein n=1 Tax=Flagellimonas meridianipacifica TaxID=1080225 RepID=A0A2T0MA71_9FLAO|nr:hypothetical protein [Allomuricauda pacifica]PRX54411.1 hypothetical protein CLV81_2812 [Allomuricauda pacifica]
MSHTRELSRYEGVFWDEPNGKWLARFEDRYLGLFNEEEEAAKEFEVFLSKMGKFDQERFKIKI